MNRSKLLAAVAVMAMVFAAVAVVSFDGNESDAVETSTINVDSLDKLTAELGKTGTSTINVTVPIEMKNDLTIDKDKTVMIIGTGKLTISAGTTLTIEGAILSNVGKNAKEAGVVNNGNLVVTDGKLLMTCAIGGSGSGNSSMVGTFTAIEDESTTSGVKYTHSYSNLSYNADKAVSSVYKNEGDGKWGYDGKYVFVYGDVVVDKDLTVSANDTYINLGGVYGQKGTLKIDSGVTVTATITNGITDDKVSLSKIKAGADGITLKAGSIVIGGTFDETTGTLTVSEGTAKIISDVTISNITLADNTTLEIPEGVEVSVEIITAPTNNATISVSGTLKGISNPELNIDEKISIEVTNTADISGIISNNVSYSPESGEFKFGDTLTSDFIVNENAYLADNLVIKEGVTLTISSNGILNLAGHNIINHGNIVVEVGGAIAGINDKNTIYLMRNSTFANEGTLGYNMPVKVAAGGENIDSTVSYSGNGSVILSDVSGTVFGLVNTTTVESSPEYTLTVSGNITSDAGSIEVTGARIVGDMTIGDNVILITDGDTTIIGGAVVTIDGSFEPTGTVMKNNSKVIINGYFSGTLNAETGKYLSTSTYDESELTGMTEFGFTPKDFNSSESETDYVFITSYELSVKTVSKIEKGEDNKDVEYIYQGLYISGDLEYLAEPDYTLPDDVTGMTFGKNDSTSPSNNYVVAGGDVLSVPKGTTMNGNYAVEGKIVLSKGAVLNAYTGSSYKVKTTEPATETTYIVPFADALAAIDTSDKKTITVKEDVKVESEITLAEGQVITISSGEFTIEDTGSLTAQAKSKITGKIADVQGVLMVYKGAGVAAPTSYASKISATDYVKYCGIKVALDDAKSGETVEINSPSEVKAKDISVKEGVTLNILSDVTAEGNITVADTGKIVVKNDATLKTTGEKAKVTIDGDLDATEGTLSVTGTNAKVSSEGIVVLTNTNYGTLKENLNAFMYKDESNNFVLTNAQDAVKNAAAQDINKTVTAIGTVTAGDIALDQNLVIDEGAKVTMGKVTVSLGYNVKIDGELTAVIEAQTGAEGAASSSAITLTKASAMTIDVKSEVADQKKVAVMYITGVAPEGTVEVTQGEAAVGDESSAPMVFSGKNILKVASGATLVIKDGKELNIGEPANDVESNAIIAGKLLVTGTGAFDVLDAAVVEIPGTLEIGDSNNNVVITGKVLLTGTILVSVTEGKESTLDVPGTIVMGTEPTTIGATASIVGAVDLDNGVIVAFADADLSKIIVGTDNADLVKTEFTINGDAYMTAYTDKGTSAKVGKALQACEFDLDGFDDTKTKFQTVKNWADSEGVKLTSDIAIGAEKTLNYTATITKVTINVSVSTGLTLSIDGVIVKESKYTLTSGEHTVQVIVNPGYEGKNIVISFNGQTVTDGKFVVTPDMKEQGITLSGVGDVSIAGGNGGNGNEMGITDYLLIILVVMVVILAIVVIMRMMRS